MEIKGKLTNEWLDCNGNKTLQIKNEKSNKKEKLPLQNMVKINTKNPSFLLSATKLTNNLKFEYTCQQRVPAERKITKIFLFCMQLSPWKKWLKLILHVIITINKVLKFYFACNYLHEKSGENFLCMQLSTWNNWLIFVLHAIISKEKVVKICFACNCLHEKSGRYMRISSKIRNLFAFFLHWKLLMQHWRKNILKIPSP